MKKGLFALALAATLAGCANSPTAPVKKQMTDTMVGQPCTPGVALPAPYYCEDQGDGRGITLSGG